MCRIAETGNLRRDKTPVNLGRTVLKRPSPRGLLLVGDLRFAQFGSTDGRSAAATVAFDGGASA
jgi:hypothetical protein